MTAYRTNPRPQPTLPRKTPWRRLALWWARGGPRRLEAARRRREMASRLVTQAWLSGYAGQHRLQAAANSRHTLHLFDSDGHSALAVFDPVASNYEIHSEGKVRRVSLCSVEWEIARRGFDK